MNETKKDNLLDGSLAGLKNDIVALYYPREVL